MLTNLKRFTWCFVITMVICACSPIISNYDQYSYTQTTSLKVDALNIMAAANEDYSKHETEATTVKVNIQKILEYEKHRPNNEITTLLWETLSDTSSNLFGGFLKEWQARQTLKPAYIPVKQKQVSEAFDKIINLEVKKIHKK